MKPPVLIGIVLGVVFIAGIWLTAAFLQPATAHQSDEAVRQSIAARTRLSGYSPTMQRLEALTNLEGEPAELSEEAQAALNNDLSRVANDVRQIDQKLTDTGIKPSELGRPTIGSARSNFPKALKANEQLLSEARQLAQQAASADRDTPVAHAALGSVELTQAAQLANAAERIREQRAARTAELLDTLFAWRRASGEVNHYADLDVSGITGQLRKDVAELGAEGAAVGQQIEDLEQQVQQREQQLAEVDEQLATASEQLRQLDEQGFDAGDDDSFQQYREAYENTSERVAELQREQQMLQSGGLRGAELSQGDWASGEISGGEEVLPLETLRDRLAAAKQKRERMQAAQERLTQRAQTVEQTGAEAAQQAERYSQRRSQLRSRLDELNQEVDELYAAARKQEEEALQRARSAASAYRTAKQAADAFVNAARQVQSTSDPQRLNRRLKTILDDRQAGTLGQSGEAAAKLLTGSILIERMLAAQDYVAALRKLADLTGGTFDREQLETTVSESRTQALDALGEAKEIYEKLAGSAGTTAWAPRSALATTYYLMSLADPDGREQHLADAARTLNEAIGNAAQNPYLRPHVVFREHLRSVGAPVEAPPEPAGDAGGDEENG